MNDFTFPKNKTLVGKQLKDFYYSNGKFESTIIDPQKPKDNQINIGGTEYFFINLDSSGKSKGSNSVILKLYESQNFDLEEIEYDIPDKILKIFSIPKASKSYYKGRLEKRFEKEIYCLSKCKDRKYQNVITIYESGTCKIFDSRRGVNRKYLYYTMEYSESDLKQFIEENPCMDFRSKINLCLNISKGIKELKSLGFYHRDIKPDNIFVMGKTWKIGDLGLISERDEDDDIDKKNEFIGPRGWITPEAMNKFLCEGKQLEFNYDCKLDHQSDIFQLGKVFWYILQNNTPVGVFKFEDFKSKYNKLYPIVRTMLNYSKKRRYNDIDEVIELLEPIEKELQLT